MSATAIAAGAFTGLQAFIDSIMYGSSILPGDMAIAIQSALLGYALMQLGVSCFSRVTVLIAPVSYEVIPFLAKVAALVGAAGLSPAATTATVLAASLLINGAAAVLFGLLSFLPLGDGLAKLLPPLLQAGVFATIGWGIYGLAYDPLGVPSPESAESVAQFVEGAPLWLPAHALGLGLWLASSSTSHPALFPVFALSLTAATHAVRLATGTSLDEAREARWLMAEAEGKPFWTLWTGGLLSGEVDWGVLLSGEVLSTLVQAVLFGPLINTLLNLVLIGPVIGEAVDTPAELRAHAAGSAAAALGGGYSNYLAVSNTAIHLKCGGATRGSCVVGALTSLLFFLVHPLFVVVGYVPTFLAAATCVYIGADFLWDALVETARERGAVPAAACYAVFAVCYAAPQGMLTGVPICVAAFQAEAAYRRWRGGTGAPPPPSATAATSTAATAATTASTAARMTKPTPAPGSRTSSKRLAKSPARLGVDDDWASGRAGDWTTTSSTAKTPPRRARARSNTEAMLQQLF